MVVPLCDVGFGFLQFLFLLVNFTNGMVHLSLRIVQSVIKFGSRRLPGIVAYITIHWPGFYAGRLTCGCRIEVRFSLRNVLAAASVLRARELTELRAARSSVVA